MMKRFSSRALTAGAATAALYALLAILSNSLGIGYGPIQFRLSEALCLLPLVLPSAVWGLGVGCFIANLFSPLGLPDLIFGTLATLLSACLTAKCRRTVIGGLRPVFCNALLVGAMLALEEGGLSAAAWPLFFYNFCTIAIGEALAVYLLGLPLLHFIKKQTQIGE